MSKNIPLFRTEALEYARERQYGVSLNTSFGVHRLLSLLAIFLTASVIFLSFFPFTRKVELVGLVQPAAGVLDISATTPGILHSVVHDGQQVVAGDVLFQIRDEFTGASNVDVRAGALRMLRLRDESLNRSLEGLDARRGDAATLLARQTIGLEAQKATVEGEIRIRKARVLIYESLLVRYKYLETQHAVPEAVVHQKEADVLEEREGSFELQATEQNLENAEISAQANYAERDFELAQHREELIENIAQVDQEIRQTSVDRDSVIKSDRSGIVTGLTVADGQRVLANERLATILPNNLALQVQLYARSDSAGFLRVGMPVTLRYRSLPFERFGQFKGTISFIERVALTKEQLPSRAAAILTSMGTVEPVYGVRVTLDSAGSDQRALLNISPGMAVDATAPIETKAIYKWALGPINSIVDRLKRN